jgi:hypothetical protein
LDHVKFEFLKNYLNHRVPPVSAFPLSIPCTDPRATAPRRCRLGPTYQCPFFCYSHHRMTHRRHRRPQPPGNPSRRTTCHCCQIHSSPLLSRSRLSPARCITGPPDPLFFPLPPPLRIPLSLKAPRRPIIPCRHRLSMHLIARRPQVSHCHPCHCTTISAVTVPVHVLVQCEELTKDAS